MSNPKYTNFSEQNDLYYIMIHFKYIETELQHKMECISKWSVFTFTLFYFTKYKFFGYTSAQISQKIILLYFSI